MSRPAGAIIPSCRSPCRSRPSRAGACWCGPGPDAERQSAAGRGGGRACATASAPHRCTPPSCSEDEWTALGAQGFLQRTDQQFHWRNEGYATLRRFPRPRSPRANARPCARSASEALSGGLDIEHAQRRRHHRKALGRVLRLLHGHRQPQVGPALSQPPLLLAARRSRMARALPADHGQARPPLRRRRAQHHRRRLPLWPLLGRHRAPPVPAFRALLLPGDRLRDRARAGARRGRRAGRAQAGARLHADDDLLGALDRRSRLSARYRALSAGRARGGRRERCRACRVRSLPQR